MTVDELCALGALIDERVNARDVDLHLIKDGSERAFFHREILHKFGFKYSSTNTA